MVYHIQARLLTPKGKPAAGQHVKLYAILKDGRPDLKDEQKSARNGIVRLKFETRSAHQPRLVLKTVIRSQEVDLSDTPEQISRNQINFGDLVVPSQNEVSNQEQLEKLKEKRRQRIKLANLGPAVDLESLVMEIEPGLLDEIRRPLEKKIGSLENERDQLKDQLDKLQQEFSSVRDRFEKDLNEKISKQQAGFEEIIRERDRQIEELKKAAEQADEGEMNVERLILSSQQQLKRAQDHIRDSGGGFRLENISFNYKLVPNEEGTGYRIPTIEELKSGQAGLSDFKIDLRPEEEQTASREQLSLPDLTGATETMARKRLDQVGLKAEVRYKTVTDKRLEGQVVRQIPDKSDTSTIPAGSTVIIMIGRSM